MNRLQCPIDTRDRDNAAVPAAVNGLAERAGPIGCQDEGRLRTIVVIVERGTVRFEAHRVYAGVRAETTGHVLQPIEDIVILRVEGLGATSTAMSSRSGTVSTAITRRAPRRKALRMANCPTGPQPQTASVSSGLITQASAAIACGEDIRQKQDLFVAESIRHLRWSDVGKWHPHVLSLPVGVTAVSSRKGPHLNSRTVSPRLTRSGWSCRTATEVVRAEIAAAARNRKRHHDAVALPEGLDVRPDVHDLAHEFVA
jgi:hypothetical protein